MTLWLAGTIALLPPLAVAICATLRGSLPQRLVALQLASCFTAIAIVMMSFAFDESSLLDLALTLGLLTLPGTLLLCVFVERWL
jgi:multicomponent Na+:H+ antiporter subunit F